MKNYKFRTFCIVSFEHETEFRRLNYTTSIPSAAGKCFSVGFWSGWIHNQLQEHKNHVLVPRSNNKYVQMDGWMGQSWS